MRELRELVSARQQLQRERVALINTLRGDVYQEGHRLPEKFFAGATWREKTRPSRRRFIRAGQSGSSGGSIGTAGRRCAGSCSSVPIRWCA